MEDRASLSLSVPIQAAALPFVRDLVGCFVSLLGAGEDTVDAVKLAVHEAAANVVAHAYEREAGLLGLNAETEAGALRIVVSDTTTTVVAESNGHGLPNASAESGRGLPIIEALTDDLELRYSAGTDTEMIFALDAPAADRPTR